MPLLDEMLSFMGAKLLRLCMLLARVRRMGTDYSHGCLGWSVQVFRI